MAAAFPPAPVSDGRTRQPGGGEAGEEDYVPPLLWSKGFARYCDFNGPGQYWLRGTESMRSPEFFRRHYADAHGLVWVRLGTRAKKGKRCDLDHFVAGALPTIRRPFALVTTDGDTSVPSELDPDTVDALLSSPWLVAWHTQNHDGTVHPKLAPIPIGLDLHTSRPEGGPRQLASLLEEIRERRPGLDQVPLRVFSDLGVNPNSEERHRALAALGGCEHADFLASRIDQRAIWEEYARYPFVLSAKGIGLDCHRTWELLYLGCIVITTASSLDPLFEGLPVVIVRDWEEVRNKDNLARWLRQYAPLTARDPIWKRLDPDRCMRAIREAFAAAVRADATGGVAE